MLEKMFDERIWYKSINNFEELWENLKKVILEWDNKEKEFFFKEMLPIVLKEIVWNGAESTIDNIEDIARARWFNNSIDSIKQKAQDLFWITL
jgi:hypothetical protein